MAGQQVNLIDAIATRTTETARARSAVLRIGTVSGPAVTNPSNNLLLVPVVVGDTVAGPGAGTVQAGFSADYWPTTGDRVALVNDRDMWIVVHTFATSNRAGYITPWALFSTGAGPSFAHATSYYPTYTASDNRGAPFIVRAADTRYLDCQVPGIYQVSMWQRVQMSVRATTGYIQGCFEGQLVTDFLVNQGGSTFIDLVYTSQPRSFAVGQSLTFRDYNVTGNAITAGAGWLSLVRVGGA